MHRRSSSVDGLTAREHEILLELGRTQASDEELALTLGIAVTTVKGHIKRMVNKVDGVRNRAGLVAMAIGQGPRDARSDAEKIADHISRGGAWAR